MILNGQNRNYLQEADSCFNKGDYECARKYYETHNTASESNNEDVSNKLAACSKCISLFAIANFLYSDRNYVKAEEQYEEILHLNPNDPIATERLNTIDEKIREVQEKNKKKESESERIPPSFPGGQQAMYEWISQNLVYPVEALENDIQGNVNLRFHISETGVIEEVEIVSGFDPACDEAAADVIKKMSPWNPSTKDGEPIPSNFNISISFYVN